MSRWIDFDRWESRVKNADTVTIDVVQNTRTLLRDAPSIDIVRCQDCKYWVYNFNGCSRNPCTEPWYATDFCNYGEREGE